MDLTEIRRSLLNQSFFNRNRNIVPHDITFIENYYIDASGNIGESDRYKYTPDYIPVVPNTTYDLRFNKTTGQQVGFTVPMYTSGKVFTSRTVAVSATGSTGKLTGQFTTGNDDYYIRFSCPKGSDSYIINVHDA